MDKLLLRTFAVISVAFVFFLGFTALLRGSQTQAQAEPVVITPEPTAMVITPEPTPDPLRGQRIFEHGFDNAPACAVCHLVEKIPGRYGVGPLLQGVATRAGERVEGLTAEEYLHTSIVDPGSYLVDGFSNAMFPKFADVLTEDQIADLTAYLMTLE